MEPYTGVSPQNFKGKMLPVSRTVRGNRILRHDATKNLAHGKPYESHTVSQFPAIVAQLQNSFDKATD